MPVVLRLKFLFRKLQNFFIQTINILRNLDLSIVRYLEIGVKSIITLQILINRKNTLKYLFFPNNKILLNLKRPILSIKCQFIYFPLTFFINKLLPLSGTAPIIVVAPSLSSKGNNFLISIVIGLRIA